MHITRKSGRSPSMMVLQACIRPFGTFLVKPGKPTPAGSLQLQPHRAAKKRCTVTERKVEEVWLYDITPKNLKTTPTRHIYYFAGGGFQSPPAPQHWSLTHELAVQLSLTVTIVSYPLAPNSPAKDSIPVLLRLFARLLRTEEEAIFMGDSAGGNVALSLALQAIQHAQALPRAIFLISPCVDARNVNPQIPETDRMDPLLNADFTGEVASKWSIGVDKADPLVSPLVGDLSLFEQHGIQLHGVVGTWDVLAPDTLLLLEKADKAGVDGRWLVWEEQMHCFPLTWRYGLKDGIAAKDWIIETLKSA